MCWLTLGVWSFLFYTNLVARWDSRCSQGNGFAGFFEGKPSHAVGVGSFSLTSLNNWKIFHEMRKVVCQKENNINFIQCTYLIRKSTHPFRWSLCNVSIYTAHALQWHMHHPMLVMSAGLWGALQHLSLSSVSLFPPSTLFTQLPIFCFFLVVLLFCGSITPQSSSLSFLYQCDLSSMLLCSPSLTRRSSLLPLHSFPFGGHLFSSLRSLCLLGPSCTFLFSVCCFVLDF